MPKKNEEMITIPKAELMRIYASACLPPDHVVYNENQLYMAHGLIRQLRTHILKIANDLHIIIIGENNGTAEDTSQPN